MQILFVHKNFPAQFGQVAAYLARHHGYDCVCVSERDLPDGNGIRHVSYQAVGGAREQTHYCSRTFENQTWRSFAVYQSLQANPSIQPDLIVCHSGFVSSLFLRDLYPRARHIGYFEFFYHVHDSDMDFRVDLPQPPTIDLMRARNRNAQLLLDLNHCDAGYSPTEFQRSQLPVEYRPKVRRIFDGIDTDFWRPRPELREQPRQIGQLAVPPSQHLITYVSRGFEAMRGFDIFLRAASAICSQRTDVHVIVVGEDRVAYGGDQRFTKNQSFKSWTIEKYQLNLERIHFIGRIAPSELAALLAVSDLHIYLTAPFVLSWSLMNALSCGCAVLASDTAPVREMIRHRENGLLVDFFAVDGFVEQALAALDDSELRETCGTAGRDLILANYALPHCLEQMQALYLDVLSGG